MYYSSTIFGQLLAFLPKQEFKRFVGQHNADRYVKKMTVWNQLVVLLYAQATGKESLRDIETGLRTNPEIWHHLGVQSAARSTVARANNIRDYRIFESLFYALLAQCRDITPERKFTFDNPLYALDATTITLCLSLFDWAHYSHEKGAIKIHTVINNRTTMPEVLTVTDGKVADITGARNLLITLPQGSIVVFDRGYVDYKWWAEIDLLELFFVTRPREYQLIKVRGVHSEPSGRVLADERIWVGRLHASEYGKELRRVRYLADTGETYEYLTNNFKLSGDEVALVYKERWRIENFFKWIKQNLHIKSFLGTSKNAVLSQVWVAMIYYLLLGYIKFQTRFPRSLLELTRMVRETLFARRPLIDLLSLSPCSVSKLLEPEVIQMQLLRV
jgi:hypothetical protein